MSYDHPLPSIPNVPEGWLDTDRESHRRRGWQGPPYFLDDNWWEEDEEIYPGTEEWMTHWPHEIEDIISYYDGQQVSQDRYSFIQKRGTDLFLYLPYQGAVVKVEKAHYSEWDLAIWYPVEEEGIRRGWDDTDSSNETYLFACEVYLSENPAPSAHATIFHPHEEDIPADVTVLAGRNFISAVISVASGEQSRRGQKDPNYRVRYSY